MIDTIFYFVSSYDTYKLKLDNNEISSRTIAFVGDQRAIYKNGIRYGSMSKEDLKALIADILAEDQSILPVATSDKLGVIKVGDTLTATEEGVLDVDLDKLFANQGVLDRLNQLVAAFFLTHPNILPKATSSTLGGVIIGGTLTYDNNGVIDYILPTASTTTKGGVKIGNGLLMDGDKILVDPNVVITGDNGEIGHASYTNYGTVKISQNGGLVVNDGLLSVDSAGIKGEKGDKGDKGDKGEKGDPGSDGVGRYTKQAFKNTETKDAPSLPNINPAGWGDYVVDDENKPYVWMCTRIMTTTELVIEDWQGPWLISGPEGTPGEDGKGVEFVYIRTNTDEVSQSAISALNIAYGTPKFQKDDYIPNGWVDNPQGVTPEFQWEWAAVRTSDGEHVWSRFNGPILWSHFGLNGMDGDGVEYIYTVTEQGYVLNDPSTWDTTTEKYQQNEYHGPEGSGWTDNPQEISQGQYQWVSTRKKHDDVWGQFSTPVIWSYIGQDGIVNGYIVDGDNLVMPVSTSSSGVANYSNSCNFYAFYNGSAETNIALDVIKANVTRFGSEPLNVFKSVIDKNGQLTADSYPAFGASNVLFVIIDSRTNTVNIQLSNIQNFIESHISVPVTITLPDETTRQLTILLFSVTAGKDGEAVDLSVSAKVIRTDYTSTVVSPSTLDVGVKINDVIHYAGETQTSNLGYTFDYYYVGKDGVIGNPVALNSKSITVASGYAELIVRMYHDGALLDVDSLPYVKDGAPGIGVSRYQVNVLSNSMLVNTDNTMSGSTTFVIVKDNDEEFTPDGWERGGDYNPTDDEYVVIERDGSTVQGTFENGVWVVNAPVRYTSTSPYVAIKFMSATNMLLASAVVPFQFKGATGSATQAINGTILRFYRWDEIKEQLNRWVFSGNYINDVDNDGSIYIDVIEYNGNYYRLKQAIGHKTVSEILNGHLPGSTDWWIIYENHDSAAFQSLISKYGFIENLTSRELVITDDENNPVAGLTSGKATATEDSDAIKDMERGSVRIWAGDPKNADLSNCPFYVTDTGKLHATDAVIKGEFSAGGAQSGVEIDELVLYIGPKTDTRNGSFFYTDGHGSICGNAIQWDTKGNINIDGVVKAQSIRNTVYVVDSSTTSVNIPDDPHYTTYMIDPSRDGTTVTLPESTENNIGLEITILCRPGSQYDVTVETSGSGENIYGLSFDRNYVGSSFDILSEYGFGLVRLMSAGSGAWVCLSKSGIIRLSGENPNP